MLTNEGKQEQRRAALRGVIVDRLLPVVEELLESEESYLALKVERIIEYSGVVRSTFYRYFKDKNELLLALSEPALRDIATHGLKPWRLSAGSTREDLAVDIHTMFEDFERHAALLRALVETSAYDPAVNAAYLAGWETARDAGAQLISDGQAAGFIRPDLPPRQTAGWFTWMAERGVHQMLTGADADERALLEESLTAIIWHAAVVPAAAR